MNILLFSSKFPPSVGGVENVVGTLSKSYKKEGNNVWVISSFMYKKGAPFFSISSQERYFGIPVYRVFLSLPRSLLGLLAFPYRFVKSLIHLRRLINRLNPDVIHFHFPDDSLFYFYLLSFLFDFPFVLSIHGNEIHLFSKNIFYRYVLTHVLKKSRFIVVNSNFMYKELKKTYPFISKSKISIIPNGINLKDFYPAKNSTKDYYLFVGRFAPKKGLDILIKAYNNVSNKITRPLYVVGFSVEQGKPLSFFKSLAKTKKIKFLGKVEKKDLLKLYQNSYYTIFPSRIEPFGIVALESLACGTPFIASDIGGFKEISLNTKAGILFKNKDILELSKVLLKVDKDKNLRESLSKRGLKSIKDYNWRIIVQRYLNLYEKTKTLSS